MKPNPSVENQSTATARKPYTTNFVISQDGTRIGYRQYGHGPGLVLEEGGMQGAEHFAQLAEALSNTFTVYVPDRRGRGLSPYDNTKEYGIQEDIEDLDAVLTKTGAHQVFGLSTGGLIVLKAALTLPAIHKIAIYEPGLSVNGSTPLDWAQRFEKEKAQGKVAAALVTGMLGPQMGPPIMKYIPRPLLVTITKNLLAHEDKNGTGEYVSMRTLLTTLHHDVRLLKTMSGTLEQFRTMQQETLLLNGSKSPAFQRFSVAALEKVIPHVKRVELPGLSHGSAWNYDKQRNPSGRPEVVAQELRRFFAEP
jgi:pimeloyl-ACP methyl ester carboxylesterase